MNGITIVPDGEALGCLRLADPLRGFRPDADAGTNRDIRRVHQWVVTQLAGPIAESMFQQKVESDYEEHKSLAVDVLANIYGPTQDVASWFGRLSTRAENLVKRHRDRISALADLLVDRRQLSPEEIVSFLDTFRPQRKK